MKTSILELDEMAPRQHSVLSLYSGAMGLDIGMHQTGRFRLLGCVEKVPAFCDTIRRNRDAGLLGRQPFEVFQADMSELDPGQLMADLGLKRGAGMWQSRNNQGSHHAAQASTRFRVSMSATRFRDAHGLRTRDHFTASLPAFAKNSATGLDRSGLSGRDAHTI